MFGSGLLEYTMDQHLEGAFQSFTHIFKGEYLEKQDSYGHITRSQIVSFCFGLWNMKNKIFGLSQPLNLNMVI